MNQIETQLLEARAILHSLFLKDTTESFVSALREHGCSAPQCPCTRARKLLALEMPITSPAPQPEALDVPTPSNAAQTEPAPKSDTSIPTPPQTEAPAYTAGSDDRKSDNGGTSVTSPTKRVAKPKVARKAATSSRKALPALSTSAGDPPSEPPQAIPSSESV